MNRLQRTLIRHAMKLADWPHDVRLGLVVGCVMEHMNCLGAVGLGWRVG